MIVKLHHLLIFLFFPLAVVGQVHVAPPDGGMGIPGLAPRSFVIAWEKVPGAIAYEYVMSDNFYCEVGCLGDTRQAMVGDTFAVEQELIEGKPYYWITRAHLGNGEATEWTLISSFMAITPPPADLIQITPNPASDFIQLGIDWQGDERVAQVRLTIVDREGQVLVPARIVATRVAGPRQVKIALTESPENAGLFLVRLDLLDARSSLLGTETQKLVLVK